MSMVWHIPEIVTVNVLGSGGGTGNTQRHKHVCKVTVSNLKDAAHLRVFQVVSETQILLQRVFCSSLPCQKLIGGDDIFTAIIEGRLINKKAKMSF